MRCVGSMCDCTLWQQDCNEAAQQLCMRKCGAREVCLSTWPRQWCPKWRHQETRGTYSSHVKWARKPLAQQRDPRGIHPKSVPNEITPPGKQRTPSTSRTDPDPWRHWPPSWHSNRHHQKCEERIVAQEEWARNPLASCGWVWVVVVVVVVVVVLFSALFGVCVNVHNTRSPASAIH